jgi:putative aminopeptidase FrvX
MGVDAVPLLKELVEIESYSGQEERASEFLVMQISRFGSRTACSTGVARSMPRGRWRRL